MSDPYYTMVQEQWSNILALYEQFEDKKPIMLFDIQEHRIYCYPYEDFKATLRLKDQLLLEDTYNRTLKNSNIIVFVKDSEERQFISYSVNPGSRPPKRRKKMTGRVKAHEADHR